MKTTIRNGLTSLSLFALLAVALACSSAVAAPPAEGGVESPPSAIRLRFATFDPLQGEPALPQAVRATALDDRAAGPYLVQFSGPVLPGWKEAVAAAGGQIDDYVPDNAFIVRLDARALASVKNLDFVRWVGIYRPAYKLSPHMGGGLMDLFRVQLASWADGAAVRRALQGLNVPAYGSTTSLVVQAQPAQLAQLAQQPDVVWIEPFYLHERLNDQATGIMLADAAWGRGYTGDGQVVAAADTGLDTGVDDAAVDGDIHLDFDNRVSHISSWPIIASLMPYVANWWGDDDGAADLGSGHGTHVTGSIAGNGARSAWRFRGVAYQATIAFQAVEQYVSWKPAAGMSDGYYLVGLPEDINELFQEAYNWGARVHNNSWGAPATGAYTVDSQHADQFTWNHKNFTIVFAAGNGGKDADADGYVDEDSMDAPATAKNVLSVGGSEDFRLTGGYNPGGPCWTYRGCFTQQYFPADPTASDRLSDDEGQLAAFSSRGPTADGRIKPDVVAPSTNVISTRSSVAAGGSQWDTYYSYYWYMGGTSMASALATGAATVVRDYLVDGEGHANPSSALIKAILINSADDMPGYGNPTQEAGQHTPNMHEGWGRIDLDDATDGSHRAFVDNPSFGLTTGLAYSFSFTLAAATTPLKVSLVWTDYPGSLAASRQLVNNLDLVVVAPDGTPYCGNRFSQGRSVTGGLCDEGNNVEGVSIRTPPVGVWQIMVVGYDVPRDPQPFALVVSSDGTLGPARSGPAPSVPHRPHIYLPLVARGFIAAKPISLANGGFEAGRTKWSEYSSHGWPTIVSTADNPPVQPHSGQWMAWLGGGNSEISTIEQRVAVPAGAPYLFYYHWITSQDDCGYDQASVRVDGQVVHRYWLCSDHNTNGWVPHSVDLSAYAGRSVLLQLRGDFDYTLISSVFIDDVGFMPGMVTSGDSLQGAPTAERPPAPAPGEITPPGPPGGAEQTR
jgi:hypothetical protein